MTAVRHTLSALWFGLAIVIVTVVGLSHIAPVLGYRLVIIAGPSMAPTIPLGAVVIERDPGSRAVSVGDVVTIEQPNGVSITHRVVRLGEANGATYLETRGDANGASDPSVTPMSAVSGVVAAQIPMVGFLLAYLAVPTGVLSIVLLMATLMLAVVLLEDIDGARERRRRTVQDARDGFPA